MDLLWININSWSDCKMRLRWSKQTTIILLFSYVGHNYNGGIIRGTPKYIRLLSVRIIKIHPKPVKARKSSLFITERIKIKVRETNSADLIHEWLDSAALIVARRWRGERGGASETTPSLPSTGADQSSVERELSPVLVVSVTLSRAWIAASYRYSVRTRSSRIVRITRPPPTWILGYNRCRYACSTL